MKLITIFLNVELIFKYQMINLRYVIRLIIYTNSGDFYKVLQFLKCLIISSRCKDAIHVWLLIHLQRKYYLSVIHSPLESLFSLFFYFYFILLYNTVLVLPYIDMNPPWVYMSSHIWTPLPPPSPYHLFGLSPCTSPKHPVTCIRHRLTLHFLHDSIHISMPFSQIIPPSPSPSESKSPLYTSVSLLLSHIQGYHFHLSKFHLYVLVYYNSVFLSGLLHSV